MKTEYKEQEIKSPNKTRYQYCSTVHGLNLIHWLYTKLCYAVMVSHSNSTEFSKSRQKPGANNKCKIAIQVHPYIIWGKVVGISKRNLRIIRNCKTVYSWERESYSWKYTNHSHRVSQQVIVNLGQLVSQLTVQQCILLFCHWLPAIFHGLLSPLSELGSVWHITKLQQAHTLWPFTLPRRWFWDRFQCFLFWHLRSP